MSCFLIRVAITTLFFIYLIEPAYGQQLADTTLQPVTVSGFKKDLLQKQAAPIAYLGPKTLQNYSPIDPVMAWNSLPGVNLEQRAISSYRVSIRGSALRSPFGVRNVKIYWNGFIFTEANGTTGLNLLSNLQMQEVEVIRGPSGSMYGAGMGGVIQINNFPENNHGKLKISLSSGSFGLFDGGFRHTVEKGKWSTHYNASFQRSDGYRDHNALSRGVLQWSNSYRFNNRHLLELHSFYSDLYYEIPGGLTLQQLNEDPTMARPGSAEQNASIDQKTWFLGTSYQSFFTKNLSQQTHIGYTYTNFKNPFILDYKKDINNEIAIRQQWSYTIDGQLDTDLQAGWEWQLADNQAKNFGNVNGKPDTIRFSDNLRIDRKIFFLQAQFNLNRWTLTAGASSNLLSYSVDRKVNAFAAPFNFEREFDNEIVPRLAIQYNWNDQNNTYISISEGFSSPTLDEIRTNEGSINTMLQAERGTSYEIGHKYYGSRFNIDASLFFLKLRETITTRTNADGVVLFQNAGETNQKGLELGA
ncbi:MAG: TonB-dependent receptor, partial [Fulvivirga sp.]|nr:TonB-dependent receptor [Fulvivirga sp.]